ncbi:MAG: CBS domain-containing protein [Gemmatimonadota bacterium]|nr:CBS domain-containing protein [Gemmatimonadota bacterium]
MTIDEILRTKGRDVVTIAPSRSVLDATRLLVEKNIGSLVVTEEGHPVGIFTERDILRLASRDPTALHSVMVGAVMTRDMVTASPSDGLSEMMNVMTHRKIRHLPVLADGALVGIISIGDLVNACRLSAEAENSHLRQYIQGVV